MSVLRRFLFIPATFLCLGASTDPGFRWYMGPVVDGRDCEIMIRFSASKFPSCYGYADVSASNGSWSVVSYRPSASMELSGAYRTYIFRLNGWYLEEGEVVTFYFGLSRDPYYPGLDYSRMHLRVKESVKVGRDNGLIAFMKDEVVETGHDLYAYDPLVDADERKIYREGYASHGVVFGNNLPNRKFPLSSITLEYLNRYLAPNENPEAELRLLSYRDDFAKIVENHGGYGVIPLKAKVVRGRLGIPTYTFSLTKAYFYSRVDYRAYSIPISDEPLFQSEDLFLPLREGHDAALYEYQVVLKNAGHYGDEVILMGSCFSDKRLFGPCDKADYCVVGGGMRR